MNMYNIGDKLFTRIRRCCMSIAQMALYLGWYISIYMQNVRVSLSLYAVRVEWSPIYYTQIERGNFAIVFM